MRIFRPEEYRLGLVGLRRPPFFLDVDFIDRGRSIVTAGLSPVPATYGDQSLESVEPDRLCVPKTDELLRSSSYLRGLGGTVASRPSGVDPMARARPSRA
jgi:hypothetical protein